MRRFAKYFAKISARQSAKTAAKEARKASKAVPEGQTRLPLYKPPNFWPASAKAWFVNVEAGFRANGVTSDQLKYNMAIQALDKNSVDRVSELAEEPPSEDKFLYLKRLLLRTFELTDDEKVRQLIDWGNIPLGDDTPSKRMQKLLPLLPEREKGSLFFRELYLRQLPESIRTEVSTYKEASFTDLGLEAERRLNVFRHGAAAPAQLSALSQRPPSQRSQGQRAWRGVQRGFQRFRQRRAGGRGGRGGGGRGRWVFHPDSVNAVEECSDEDAAGEAGASCMSLAFGSKN